MSLRRSVNASQGQHVGKRFTERLILGPASPSQQGIAMDGTASSFHHSPHHPTKMQFLRQRNGRYLL